MNPMQNKTPEERKAIAAKAKATLRSRLDAEKVARQDALKYAGGLREKISELEDRLAALQRQEALNAASAALTGKALLREEQIAQAALPWSKACGVYFLISGTEVVYVGQSVNIYSRIGAHTEKRFDRFAFVPCAVDALDMLESLYIHCLRPRLNGDQSNGVKSAPISLDALVSMVSRSELKKIRNL